MSYETTLSQVYATDEDIAVRAYGDFVSLCPASQILAMASDGVIAGWTLTSASQDFATQGIQVSHVVQISGPSPAYKGAGQLFAVGAVSGNSVTLRRIGQPDGIGLSPDPGGGLSGVTFAIRTFGPQIEDASYQANTQYGIDPGWQNTSPNLIYDLRIMRQATVLTVLVRAYASDTRSKDGDFAIKLATFRQELSDARGLVQVRWTTEIDTPPASSFFSTRIVR